MVWYVMDVDKCEGKMNPRKDLLKFGPPEQNLDPHLILRRGIPFGPELTTEEKLTRRTKHERGLLFVSYQSDLSQGFSFLQKGRPSFSTPSFFLFPISLSQRQMLMTTPQRGPITPPSLASAPPPAPASTPSSARRATRCAP